MEAQVENCQICCSELPITELVSVKLAGMTLDGFKICSSCATYQDQDSVEDLKEATDLISSLVFRE